MNDIMLNSNIELCQFFQRTVVQRDSVASKSGVRQYAVVQKNLPAVLHRQNSFDVK